MTENKSPEYEALRVLLFNARTNTFIELGERENSSEKLRATFRDTYQRILLALGDPKESEVKRRLAYLAGSMLNAVVGRLFANDPHDDTADFQKRGTEAIKALEAYLAHGIVSMCPPPPPEKFMTVGLSDAETVLSAVWSCIHAETAATAHMPGNVLGAAHSVLEGHALRSEPNESRAIFTWWLNAVDAAYHLEGVGGYVGTNTYRVYHNGELLDVVSDTPAHAVAAYFKFISKPRNTTVVVRSPDRTMSAFQTTLVEVVTRVVPLGER